MLFSMTRVIAVTEVSVGAPAPRTNITPRADLAQRTICCLGGSGSTGQDGVRAAYPRLESLADELRAATPNLVVRVDPCDLTDREALAALADRAVEDGVDVLVHNAGLGDISPTAVVDLSDGDVTILREGAAPIDDLV